MPMHPPPPPPELLPESLPESLRATAGELLDRLAAGEASSRALVEDHIARIEAIDDRVGAIAHRRFDAARREAEAADARRAKGDGGPLCGLPITVKENFLLEGTPTTIGVRARSAHRAAHDAVLVEALRGAGAVVLGKTNVPQLLLAQESENALYGRTANPWHLERVPGGSSGGEAAAIAAGMSPLGIGSDIGGSIRIPCHFTGVAGFKPTLDRWSNRGMIGPLPGLELVRAQCGPMARAVGDLIRVWQAIDPIQMASRDPFVPPMPAGDPAAVDLRGLRIGWYVDDGYLAPSPAIRRAVEQARDALRDAGATLVEHREPDEGAVLDLWISALSADGGDALRRVLDGEAFAPVLRPMVALLRMPDPARKALAAVAERLGERRIARQLRAVGRRSVDGYWDRVAARTALRRDALDAWNRARLDAVVCPPHVSPAMAHRASADFALGLASMFRYAIYNFPAGIVPAARVTEADVAAAGPRRGDRIERKRDAIHAAGLGLPVGVQVVARPYREDIALAVMAAVERDAMTRSDYPRTPIDPMP